MSGPLQKADGPRKKKVLGCLIFGTRTIPTCIIAGNTAAASHGPIPPSPRPAPPYTFYLHRSALNKALHGSQGQWGSSVSPSGVLPSRNHIEAKKREPKRAHTPEHYLSNRLRAQPSRPQSPLIHPPTAAPGPRRPRRPLPGGSTRRRRLQGWPPPSIGRRLRVRAMLGWRTPSSTASVRRVACAWRRPARGRKPGRLRARPQALGSVACRPSAACQLPRGSSPWGHTSERRAAGWAPTPRRRQGPRRAGGQFTLRPRRHRH